MSYKDGEIIGEHGSVKIYKTNDQSKLVLERDNDTWAFGNEIRYYKRDIGNSAKGDCLEIGLGLGVASRHILSFPVEISAPETDPIAILYCAFDAPVRCKRSSELFPIPTLPVPV